MIFVFLGLCMAAAICLPWWALPALAVFLGFAGHFSWKKSLIASLVFAGCEVALAIYFDRADAGLISRRLSGIFSVRYYVIYFMPAALGFWAAFFFSRLGGSVRALVSPASKPAAKKAA